MLGMSLVLAQTQIFFDSIFVKAEEKLDGNDYQRALGYVSRYKTVWNEDRYRCLMDFFFVEMFPTPWRQRCQLYYDGEGKLAKEYMTKREIRAMDNKLCAALTHWSHFRKIVLEELYKDIPSFKKRV